MPRAHHLTLRGRAQNVALRGRTHAFRVATGPDPARLIGERPEDHQPAGIVSGSDDFPARKQRQATRQREGFRSRPENLAVAIEHMHRIVRGSSFDDGRVSVGQADRPRCVDQRLRDLPQYLPGTVDLGDLGRLILAHEKTVRTERSNAAWLRQRNAPEDLSVERQGADRPAALLDDEHRRRIIRLHVGDCLEPGVAAQDGAVRRVPDQHVVARLAHANRLGRRARLFAGEGRYERKEICEARKDVEHESSPA
jgi:hypothetical protein